ncbi:hypothetical protein AURANDRAFT_61337 [Aureococcus anophagefferens]|uniref:Uncharacterized protein n=1 Tax=Aureococcus anophagefferens TaxID=44056 RepID=F0XXZ8_AURAN|nr:hypothetical protein AURANDRAFT_61337 [Aureococcus anophagefferens]EGB12259.1 hypothetical protein AURANDRAFT_61337 [Aureococcus anophagefferens]|eukprot:XP_009033327.1 hypothetical protein AURANDRAFT_61337 [Aureococcus anophagefferens]
MKKAPTLLLALVVAAVRGDDCSSYDWDDKVACDEDSDCVWLQNWWSCRDNCEGWDEDGCDEADHCAWSDSSNTCSLSCEHKYSDDDGCWFEGGSYDVDDDHRDCFSEGLCTSSGNDCCASMDWGEPATCVEGYYPVPAYPTMSEDDCSYTCCATVPDGYDYEEPEDCSAKHGRLQGSCDADDDCVWMAGWNTCKDECSNLDEDDCHDHCEYDWDNEEDDCDADDSCQWVAGWNTCKDECSNLDEDDCHDHCEYDWDNEVCFTRCNAKYQDEEDCDADDSCQWVAGWWNTCKDKCSNLDEDDCHDHCEYDWDNEDDGCNTNWYYKDWEHDDDDDDGGGSSLGALVGAAVGGISVAAAVGGIFATALSVAFASSVNSMRDICAIGPTIGMGFNEAGTYFIGPQLCSIGGTHYKSKRIVHANSAKGACREFCAEAELKFSSVELFTCYCSK